VIPRLVASPLTAALVALAAGAAAAHDPALRPRFDLLLLFAAYVLALIALEMRIAHGHAAKGRGRTMALAGLALLAGVTLIAVRGWPGFWIVGTLGLLALAFVTGPRLADTSLGGVVTVAVLGPLTTAGAALAVVGHVSPTALWIGLPIGLLADAARRARDTAAHEGHGVHARAGESPAAPPWFLGDLVAAFGVIPALVALGTLPWIALLSWITLPWALGEATRARSGTYVWGEAARRTRRLHLSFALLLAAAVLVARIIVTRLA
jgi:1,4-dihydroxy-2-naphthoate octaprenyltransferase